jgi:hypothetical protein
MCVDGCRSYSDIKPKTIVRTKYHDTCLGVVYSCLESDNDTRSDYAVRYNMMEACCYYTNIQAKTVVECPMHHCVSTVEGKEIYRFSGILKDVYLVTREKSRRSVLFNTFSSFDSLPSSKHGLTQKCEDSL